ncbi:MAG TPA: ribosome biogenesis GTPase Der [Verrucomicrobiota bacterium]|nr:ribosome biogenesis GTPase Der [Verrucomicrobiota bacterium]
MPGLIAIVGRPNVGKAALFNRIAGRRIAIVHDQPGVTRDRVSAEAEWRGRAFTLVDTGGIGLRPGEKAADVIQQAALEQVDLALEAASVIVQVVNVQEGLVPLDQEVAARLRAAGKPVLLAVNKADQEKLELGADEFAALGFAKVFPVSAIHGRGVEALLREAVKHLPAEATPERRGDGDEDEDGQGHDVQRPLRLAIVGRPNVGKSSIINALTHSNRVIVSPVAGTTRDAVDVPFTVETEGRIEPFVLIDTAGLRKRTRVDNSIEFFSVKRTEDAIARADLVVLVLDAADGILEQDKKIGALITEARRACVIVVNKWDLVAEAVRRSREEEMARREARKREPGHAARLTTLGEFGEWVQEKLFFLDYAPVLFTSAATGFHLDRLLEAVRYVAAQLRQRVPTAILNRTLQAAVERKQPVSATGTHLRFFYATQTGEAPPRFLLFVNRRDLPTRAYEKYLADALRTAFGFEGCPVTLSFRERPKTIEPKRKWAGAKPAARKVPRRSR